MKLTEVYDDLMVEKAWKKLDEILSEADVLQEADPTKLNLLLKNAKVLIFDAFGFAPSERKYFIAGSARLFKNPMLLKALNELDSKTWPMDIGDLDVIVPNESDWQNLYKNYTTTDSEFIKKIGKVIGEQNVPKIVEKFKAQWQQFGGKVYRPGLGKNGLGLVKEDIEVFTYWDPKLAKDPGAKDFDVRSDQEILKDAVNLTGFYFMSIYDVMDYKSKLSREKERELVKFIQQFIESGETPQAKEVLFKNIYALFKVQQVGKTE
jgi:hypothetical protein